MSRIEGGMSVSRRSKASWLSSGTEAALFAFLFSGRDHYRGKAEGPDTPHACHVPQGHSSR